MADEKKFDSEKIDVQRAIQIGFDVLHILADRFRPKVGQEFDNTWSDCLKGLEGIALDLFKDISSDKENQYTNVYIIKARYDGFEGQKDATVLLDAFAGFIKEMITSIKRYLGEGIVEEAVQEAIKILSMVEKYQQGIMITEYFIDRLREIDSS